MRLQKIIFLFLFVLLFFAVRLHFYRTPLFGEEGIFAALIVHQPENPKIQLGARIDGVNRYSKVSHPIGLYSVIKVSGSLFRPFLAAVDWQNDAEITPRLRFVFSLFQFVILLGISLYIVFLRKWPIHILLAAIFIAVTISPVALDTSWNLQLDGSVGVLMNGLLAVALMLLIRDNSLNIFTGTMLFATSVFLALGKQEWSIILLVALGISAVYYYVLKMKTSQPIKPYFIMLLIILAGLIAGNIISYLSMPEAYFGGIEVLWRFSRVEKILDGQTAIEAARFVTLTINRLQWICTSIALVVIFGISILNDRKWPKPAEFLLFIFGLGLFGAFFISLHNAEPRYFAPSLVVLTMAAVAIFPQKMNTRYFRVIATITLLMFASSGVFLYARTIVYPMKPYFDASDVPLKPGQAAILSSGVAWNKMEIDFVNSFAGKSRAKRYSDEKNNKELYPTDFK